MEKLQEWMTEKVYGLNGTKDKTLKIRGNPRVYFDITLDGEDCGRVVMQLRKDVVPKTAEVRAARRWESPGTRNVPICLL